MQQRVNDKTYKVRPKRDSQSNRQIRQKAEESDVLMRDYNPLENITCKIGDNACAAKHVSVIQRSGLFRPMSESQRVQSLLKLQQQYGNRLVQRVIAQHAIQTKLQVGKSADIYEQEANRVADAVMRMPEPSETEEGTVPEPAQRDLIQRLCPAFEENLHRQSIEDELMHLESPQVHSQQANQPAGASTPARSSATAKCTPKPLSRKNFLKEPGTKTSDFGWTDLDPSKVTYPEVRTQKKGGGVTVEPTTAALPPIPSIYTGKDVFTEGEQRFDDGDCNQIYYEKRNRFPIEWTINDAGAKKLAEGEQEHCDDFQYAFNLSLRVYADAVNRLAKGGRVFPGQRAVEWKLKQDVGVAPADWKTVFKCLTSKTKRRDEKPSKGGLNSHTPRPTTFEPKLPDCKYQKYITGKSLPLVGKFASSKIIKDCGEAKSSTP